MKITFISDTHTKHNELSLPGGDVLVHCGDFSYHGTWDETVSFANWFATQNYHHKIVIAGNHELTFDTLNRHLYIQILEERGITYLHSSSCVIDGVKFFGHSWTPRFYDWAMNIDRNSPAMEEKCSLIEDDVDILISHGPPKGILDLTQSGKRDGCEKLIARVQQLQKLKIHAFGHFHLEGGKIQQVGEVEFINCAVLNDQYKCVHKPVTVEI